MTNISAFNGRNYRLHVFQGDEFIDVSMQHASRLMAEAAFWTQIRYGV
jgi:hypothetical protein